MRLSHVNSGRSDESEESHLAHGELLRPEARDGLREGRDADGVLERVALAEHGPQPESNCSGLPGTSQRRVGPSTTVSVPKNL